MCLAFAQLAQHAAEHKDYQVAEQMRIVVGIHVPVMSIERHALDEQTFQHHQMTSGLPFYPRSARCAIR